MSFFDDPPIHDFPDRAFRRALEHPHNLRDLLEVIVPAFAFRLDFDRVEIVGRDFLLEDWRGRESDLLLRIPYRGTEGEAPVLVVVRLEHQSRPDPRLPLRLLVYAMRYWEREWRRWEANHSEGKGLRLTPILPIVFHTGATTWNTNRTLAELIAGPKELQTFAPNWPVIFWDLAERTPDQLLSAAGAFVQLLTLPRAERSEAAIFQVLCERLVRQLEPLADQDKMRWHDLLWIVASWAIQRRPAEERDPLISAITESQIDLVHRQEVRKMNETLGLSWADLVAARAEKQGEQRGEERGRREATLQTLRETLTSILTANFGSLPEALTQQIQSCKDVERLRTGFQQALKIETLGQFQL